MPRGSLLRKILTVVGFLLAFALAMVVAVGNATSAPLTVRSISAPAAVPAGPALRR
jgi:hypothetical protein